MKDMHSTARFSSEIIPESSASDDYFEQPHENMFENIHEKDDNEAPTRSKRQRTAKSFGDDFIVYLVDDTPKSIAEAYASHMHHQMQMIGKKLSKMRWTRFFLMEHENYQSAPMAVSPWAASECSKRS
jgi:hypothetical protein